MSIKRSKAELEIIEFTSKLGRFEAWGVVSVLAARKLVGEGLIKMLDDNADASGIGHVLVGKL